MSRCRRGFSLLEVLVATAIFLGCVIVLAQLSFIGRQHAAEADDLGDAQRLCQNKLAEILTGLAPLYAVDNEILEEQAGWVYSIAVNQAGLCGLTEVRVTVSQDPNVTPRPRSFTLVRWISPNQALAADNPDKPDADNPDQSPMSREDMP